MIVLRVIIVPMLLIGGGQAFADETVGGPIVRDHRSAPGLQPPSNLQANEITSTHLMLSWTDNSTSEFGVRLYRGLGVISCEGEPVEERGGEPITWDFVGLLQPFAAMTETGTRRAADRDLTPQTNYCYRMYAYNGYETSEYSDAVCMQTLSHDGARGNTVVPVCQTGDPAAAPLVAPSNLAISDLTSTTLTLSWYDNSTAELGVSVEQIDIERSDDRSQRPGEGFANWIVVLDIDEPNIANRPGTGMRSRAVSDLTPDTNYCFRMRAQSGDQMSEYSELVCVEAP